MSIGIKATADGLSGALQVGGTDVLRFGADSSGQLAGFRNRFINGDMRISQEFGTVSTALPAATIKYATDQWTLYGVGAATTFQQVEVTSTPFTEKSSALQVVGASGLTSIEYAQRIEAVNSRDLAGLAVVLSGWVYQSSGASVTLNAKLVRAGTIDNLSSGTADDAVLTCTPSNIPNGVWTKISCVGTLSTAATLGLKVAVWLAGTLSSGAVTFTQLQFEIGSIATSFEERDFASEFVRCQRYYEVGSEPRKYISNLSGVTLAYDECRFQTRKRVPPAMTLSANWEYYSAGTGTAFTPTGVGAFYDKFTWQTPAVTNWSGWNGVGTWIANARL